MSFVSRLAPAAAIVLVSCLVAPAASSPAVAPTPVARGVEGSWTGPFAQADWTFEFKQQGGVWSGRYMSSKGNEWHPMQSLVASARTIRFSMDSKPLVTFSLEVGPTNETLTGDVNVFGRNLPFSATRRW